MRTLLLVATTLAVVHFVAPGAAQASQLITSNHVRNSCLSSVASGMVLDNCNGRFHGQNFRWRNGGYGQIVVDGHCLATASNAAGARLIAQTCNASARNQRWGLQPNGALRNEEGWCADIQGAGGIGTPVVAWHCNNQTNQRWGFAGRGSAQLLTDANLLTPAQRSALPRANAGDVITADGRIIAAAQVIASGGNNVIAPGGNNVIAAGGNNFIVLNGGNVIAPGGNNLVQQIQGALRW